jgi:hypothetical protein
MQSTSGRGQRANDTGCAWTADDADAVTIVLDFIPSRCFHPRFHRTAPDGH